MIPVDALPRLLPSGLADEAEAANLADHLSTIGADALRALGFRTRLRLIGAAGERFLDPDDPLRREAEERLPGDAALSPAEARHVIDGMARDWTMERLSTLLRADFPDPEVLDGFRPGVRGDRVRAVPPRLLVVVGSGNVPGTGATALMHGLLVGAPTLLKPGAGDRVLSELVGRALRDAHPALADALAVVGWPGGAGGEIERTALDRAERIVVYGGEEAVRAVRVAAGPLTPVVAHGPRIGAGVVLADATGADGPVLAAAAAISAYEQRGCVSPQLIWVEEGGARTPVGWAEALAEALHARAEREAAAGDDERRTGVPRAEMRALADEAEYRAATDDGSRVFGSPAEGWLVLHEPGAQGVEPTCLGRTVRVRPLGSMNELPGILAPAARRLQTIAVEGAEPGRSAAALLLARAGATRVTTFRDQPWPPAWWRHDGEGPLRTLVRWVTLEPADRMGPEGATTPPPAAPNAR